MFSIEESLAFLAEQLEIKDVKTRIMMDRKGLLDEFAIKMQTKIPFHNLALLSKPAAERRRPTLEEVKASVVTLSGGLCYNLNLAAYFLLKPLGFNVSLAHATCTSTVLYPNNHLVVYVQDVQKSGDKYILEVGLGFPTFRIISTNFSDESDTFKDSFLEYKYVKHGGNLLRMHRKGDPIKESGQKYPHIDFYLGEFRRFYYVNIEGTQDVSQFDKYFDDVFTKAEASPFHLSHRILQFPDQKAVMVINGKFISEKGNGILVPKTIEGGDSGIVEVIESHFPIIPRETIQYSIDQWRLTQ